MSQPIEVRWWDVLGVLAVFWLPGATIWMILGWRAYRELRRQRDLDRLEADSLREEGFSPGPPTRHRPSDQLDE